jgi:hypothetical protein
MCHVCQCNMTCKDIFFFFGDSFWYYAVAIFILKVKGYKRN